MNELTWRHHFPIISLWEIFRRSRAANFVVCSPIWPKFKLVRDCTHVLVTCKYKKDRIKSNREKVETPFSPLYTQNVSQWGLSVDMDKSDPARNQTYFMPVLVTSIFAGMETALSNYKSTGNFFDAQGQLTP